jgi:hypothetical protein
MSEFDVLDGVVSELVVEEKKEMKMSDVRGKIVKMGGGKWLELKGIRVRKGMRDGWFEMLVRKENGKVEKMVGKKVGRFLSELNEVLDLGDWKMEESEEEF